MAPLRDAYLSGLMQTFITKIALLILSQSVLSPFSFFFLSELCLNLRPPLPIPLPKRISALISAARLF